MNYVILNITGFHQEMEGVCMKDQAGQLIE